MITGLNQNLEIQGRALHLQTEVTMGEPPTVRTVVYHGGRIVASRESQVPDTVLEGGEAAVRGLMERQHELIGRAVVERASKGWAPKRSDNDPGPGTGRGGRYTMKLVSSPPSKATPSDLSPQLKEALKIRRAFTRFKARIENLEGQELAARLAGVAVLLEETLTSALIQRVRVDEQVRFSLLQGQVSDWLHGAGEHDQGQGLWSEIQSFVAYLMEINYRAELIEFDRRVLAWGVARAEGGSFSPEVRKKLTVLFGRDPELDRLLGDKKERPADLWTTTLGRVLGELGQPGI